MLGFRETVLGTVALPSMMPTQQGCFSKHWGRDHLRTGLRTLMYFAPHACWFLSTYLLRAGTGPVPYVEQLGRASSTHGPKRHSFRRKRMWWCYYPLLDGKSTRIASPSISSCLKWDTAGQLAPMAALRAPHGRASKGTPKVHGKQSCSRSPDSIQRPTVSAAGTAISTLSTSAPLLFSLCFKSTRRNASGALFLHSRNSCETLT